MSRSEIIREKRENVSLEFLATVLDTGSFEALCRSLSSTHSKSLDESIYDEYFKAPPEKTLNEEDQMELFENLGSSLVKSSFSTEQLRSFLESKPREKRRRPDE